MATSVAYVLGSDHSGTTLLGFLLDCHPRIICVGEVTPPPGWFSPEYLCSCGEKIRSCPFFTEVSRRMAEKGQPFEPGSWSLSFNYEHQWLRRLLGSYSYRSSKRRVQFLLDKVLPFHRQRIRQVRRLNALFYRVSLEIADASVFCETTKELHRFHHLSQIREVELSVIWLIRDLRAYVFSCSKFGLEASRSAGQWKRYQELSEMLFETTPSEKRIKIKYEDLCQYPESTLARVHRVLGLGHESLPNIVSRKSHHILGNKMRKDEELRIRFDEAWKRDLPLDQLKRALLIAGDVNERLGYS